MQTHIKASRKFSLPAIVLVGLVATVCMMQTAEAQPPAPEPQNQRDASSYNDPVMEISSKRSNLKIVEKFAKVVKLSKKIARVDGFDPVVINVTALSPNQVRVQALTPGVTTMLLIDEEETTHSVEVFVMGDVRHLQAYINRFFRHASVEAVAVGSGVVLRGWVQQPSTITELVEIAEEFYPRVLNQMKVGGAQQVLLNVKVMEVQRTKIRNVGFNFLYANDDGAITSTIGDLSQLSGFSVPMGGPPAVTFNPLRLADSTIVGGITDNNNIFQGFLEALREESLLKILAQPKLVATNGRPAHLLAGGEFPILVPQSLGTTTIEWREFGVRLQAVPIMLGAGRVRLELQPEVSERDLASAVTIGGTIVPGLKTRRVNTQVEMKFGQTFVLAGLLSSQDTAQAAKVPVLGEMPWVGPLFSRKSYEKNETELVIMVTPELIGPLGANQVPAGGPGLFTTQPTDRELFNSGFLEVPNYGDQCEGCDVLPPGVLAPEPAGNNSMMSPGGFPTSPVDNRATPPMPAPPAGHSLNGQRPKLRSRLMVPTGGEMSSKSVLQTGGTSSRLTNGKVGSRASRSRTSRPGLIGPRPGLIGPSATRTIERSKTTSR